MTKFKITKLFNYLQIIVLLFTIILFQIIFLENQKYYFLFLLLFSILIFIKSKYNNNVCAICLEKIKFDNNIKLKCNHTFHSQCIIKWFRTNKSGQCPCCRDTDFDEEILTQLNNINLNEINEQEINNDNISNWQNHPHVILYLNNNDIDNKDIIINAYYIRDLYFSRENNYSSDHYYNYIVNSLRLSDEKIDNEIIGLFKNSIKNELNKINFKSIYENNNENLEDIDNQEDNLENKESILFIENFKEYFLSFYHEKINSDDVKKRKEKFNNLYNNRNTTDTRVLYRFLDVDDLNYLGW